MILYSGIKTGFMNDVRDNLICNKIYEQYKKFFGKTSESQMRSWQNSMQYVRNVLDSEDIPDNCGVAIEYNIPTTSKRIDFILTGINPANSRAAIIIELKQWSECESVYSEDGIVKTFVGGGIRKVAHPSYQAMSYAAYIDNYNEAAQNGKMELLPCVFLHNYHFKDEDPINSEQYKNYIEAAPIFGAEDFSKLREFISEHIKKGDDGETIYKIEHGRFRPSKSLQDCLSSMLKGNQEFVMIDDQKVAFETAMRLTKESVAFGKKNVVVIEGGPGTGKSVLAINLIVALTNCDITSFYVTRNGSPRAVFKRKLQGDNFKKAFIDSCFQNSGNFYNVENNAIDSLVVDEAHRLTEKSGFMGNLGENQIKEIINSSKCSIFLIDEDQRVTLKDIGTIGSIKKYSNELGAKLSYIKLRSQFRCNGSDGYITWLNDVLGISEGVIPNDMDFKYDIRVFDNPNDLRDAIIKKNEVNNKSRIVAGYCWDWLKEGKDDSSVHDIVIPQYNFGISWNLGTNSQTWAINQGSINEAGCIHTCQGLEFDYVGVIIGNDLRYENGKVVTDISARASTDQSVKGWKTLMKKDPENAAKILDRIIKNTYKVLMTRGMKGCYIFCLDKGLQSYLKNRINMLKQNNNDFNDFEPSSLIQE